jgi:hypothetical protein
MFMGRGISGTPKQAVRHIRYEDDSGGQDQARPLINEGEVGRVLTRQGDIGRNRRAEARPT